MAAVYVKLVRSPERVRVPIDFSQTVTELKTKVANETGIPPHLQRMVYWGKILDDTKSLMTYKLRNHSTIYVIKMEEEATVQDVKGNEDEEVSPTKLSSVLETAIKNPLYKHSVRKILQDSEAFEQVVAATNGLKKDHVAMTLLKDPELLLQVSDTANVERIVQEHPALAQAASHIIAAITEDTSATRQLLQGRRNIGDDSDEDLQEFEPELIARAEMMAAAEEQHEINQSGEATRDARITQAQLSDALNQAVYRPNPTNTSDPGPSRQRQNIITSEFFSQALSSAISSTANTLSVSNSGGSAPPISDTRNPSSDQPEPSRTLNAEALQQMRDMGISNDELSARALELSGGDVQAAINLIFEGALF